MARSFDSTSSPEALSLLAELEMMRAVLTWFMTNSRVGLLYPKYYSPYVGLFTSRVFLFL